MRVGKMSAANHDQVELPVLQDALGQLGCIDTPGGRNGDIYLAAHALGDRCEKSGSTWNGGARYGKTY